MTKMTNDKVQTKNIYIMLLALGTFCPQKYNSSQGSFQETYKILKKSESIICEYVSPSSSTITDESNQYSHFICQANIRYLICAVLV